MSPRFSPSRRLVLLVVLVAIGSLAACVGATRMPVRSRGPGDLSFKLANWTWAFSGSFCSAEGCRRHARLDRHRLPRSLICSGDAGRIRTRDTGWLVVAAVPGGGG